MHTQVPSHWFLLRHIVETVFINSATCSCIQQSNHFCYSQATRKFVEKSSHNPAQTITLEKANLFLASAADTPPVLTSVS